MSQRQQTTLKSGLWPVMLTPFLESGAIDWNGLDALTDWYLKAGAAGLFACCLSSEMYSLTPEERVQLIQHIVDYTRGRVDVVAAGAFGATISDQVEAIRRIADTGVRAVVLLTNQFVTENEGDEALRKWLEEILQRTGDIPLGLYECPLPYLRLASTETLRWAAHTGRFLFSKDVSCNVDVQRERIQAVSGTPLSLFDAHRPTVLESMRAGGAGFSGIAANLYPELFTWMTNHWREQPQMADKLQVALGELDRLILFHYPRNAKRFLKRLGLPIQEHCRIPAAAPSIGAAYSHAGCVQEASESADDEATVVKIVEIVNRLHKTYT